MPTFLADLHVHTHASLDGRSGLRDLAAAARQAGLHAIAITDHDLCTECPPELEGVVLIPGCEISSQAGHIIGLFLRRHIDPQILGSFPTGEAAVAAIREAGGLAVLAHPYQRPGAQPLPLLVDGIETVNARATMKVPDANEKAAALASRLGLPGLGGSDAHHSSEVGNAYTRIRCPELTLDELRKAVAEGAVEAVLQKPTTHLQKGFSQWAKARKQGGLLPLCRGVAYLVCCLGRDLRRR